jgi:hypothetical protein
MKPSRGPIHLYFPLPIYNKREVFTALPDIMTHYKALLYITTCSEELQKHYKITAILYKPFCRATIHYSTL